MPDFNRSNAVRFGRWRPGTTASTLVIPKDGSRNIFSGNSRFDRSRIRWRCVLRMGRTKSNSSTKYFNNSESCENSSCFEKTARSLPRYTIKVQLKNPNGLHVLCIKLLSIIKLLFNSFMPRNVSKMIQQISKSHYHYRYCSFMPKNTIKHKDFNHF